MNVLITGGSRGIGAACVRKFISEGYSTAFIYLNSDEKAAELHLTTGASPYRCDVSYPAKVEETIMKVNADIGYIDILVNCAGIALSELFQDTKNEEWKRIFEVNVEGTFNVTKAVIEDMIRRKSGSIVNVSSLWGIAGASCETCYSSSKAAIIGMTKALAKEVGPCGITVNCVAPGYIDTDMNSNISDEDRKTFADDTPLGRTGTAEEVAEAIYFLASPKSSFITGQVLAVDGGYTI
jgi:3-oxoacyl-[acyl-carrier protein] reductase